MYYVYLLESLIDKLWYIGFTPDSPLNRLFKHNNKEVYYSSGAGHRFLKKQIKNYLNNL